MLDSRFWERYFAVYDNLNQLIPYQELLSSLESELELQSDDVVLDVGSGTGNFMIRIRGKCKEVIGIDYAKEGIELHKKKDPQAKAILHDITKPFPFSDSYFTKVVSNNAIYALMLPQQKEAFSEMARVLKSGGTVVVSNVKEGWSAWEIYKKAIKGEIEQNGLLFAATKVIKIIIPTVKIFYYNLWIAKESKYHFLKEGEQSNLLKETGLIPIKEIPVYAGQALLTKAIKN